ncbi:uncharacterized protein CCOS01_16310 [Colletotrichum costaricense]|uniref:Uncharacterized protein n=1 Tax=Colletotrichum costaricense TaxID=1209916 RepID=A0AAJ0DSR1_9PEZI|nr:uncharacterized protein CCOS01_16310 [Colletotrichum costaricense]KAK1507051.1 hypothetical protein CCOS01_16310 [Colletotrichum costaricense]
MPRNYRYLELLASRWFTSNQDLPRLAGTTHDAHMTYDLVSQASAVLQLDLQLTAHRDIPSDAVQVQHTAPFTCMRRARDADNERNKGSSR